MQLQSLLNAVIHDLPVMTQVHGTEELTLKNALLMAIMEHNALPTPGRKSTYKMPVAPSKPHVYAGADGAGADARAAEADDQKMKQCTYRYYLVQTLGWNGEGGLSCQAWH